MNIVNDINVWQVAAIGNFIANWKPLIVGATFLDKSIV